MFRNSLSIFLKVIELYIQKGEFWMDLEIIILSEVSQTEKDKYHLMSLICKILKNNANELIYKTDSDF